MSAVRDFGAVGDGVADDTDAIQHAVDQGDGVVQFGRGRYRITRPILIRLGEDGPIGVVGAEGTATLVMAGEGPALQLVGEHGGTANPKTVKPEVMDRERMPTIRNLCICGEHEGADGIELIGTMGALLEGVLLQRLRHGILLRGRNRNVLISHCHVYHNTGVGIFLDGVNLHQINIVGSHISYNRLGGIRIERSEVRNLQITGNDIEYNNSKSHPDFPDEPTAEVYVDSTAEGASVCEVTIASNTIQATATPGGSNIRILEDPDESRPPGLWSIAGNIIGSQENNIHLTGCSGITVTGNTIYSASQRNVLIEKCSHINLSGNLSRRHVDAAVAGVRIVDSEDCILSAWTLDGISYSDKTPGGSLLELERCRRIQISACQILGGVSYGIDAADCDHVRISDCTVTDPRDPRIAEGAVRFTGRGRGNRVSISLLGGEVRAGADAGLRLFENDEL